MANNWQASKTLATAAANNIATSQSPGSGAITLNGSLVSDGVATLDTPRQVRITSGADDSSITFTVTGTNYSGAPLEETVAGTNGSTSDTTQDFATVTSVTHTGSVTGTLTIGTNTIGSTPWYVTNQENSIAAYGICVVVSGTVNYTVEYTYDDPNDPFTGTFPTTFSLTALAAQNATKDSSISSPVLAIRATVNSGTGTIYVIVIQDGEGHP